MNRALALLVLGCTAGLTAGLTTLAHPAHAQSLDLSGGGPVDVTARGGFEWRENEQIVIASDEARAVRDNVTVLADRLVARYRKKAPDPNAPPPAPKPANAPANPNAIPGTGDDNGGNEVYRLEAHGHVRILTETDEAVGDDAVYDIDQAVLVMTGKHLKLTTPQQVMTARDTMEYWSQKHMAVGRGDAVVVTTDGRRLSGDVLVAFTTEDQAGQTPGQTPAQTPAQTPGQPAPTPKPVPVKATPAPGADPAKTDPLNSSGKLQRIEAYGNVEVRTAVDTVRGDRGLYIADTDIARVVGHVRITHYSQQTNGAAADINMKTGIARVNSAPGARVNGLIVPNDPLDPSHKQQTAPAAKPKAP